MATNTRVITASRAGVASVVITETTIKTYNIADVGVVNEAPGSGGGGATGQSVQVLVLA